MASALSAAGLQGLPAKGARVIIEGNKASLLIWNEAAGRWGVSPGSRNVPISLEPAVGKAPLELWRPANDVPEIPGVEAYSGMHAGNEITQVSPGLHPEDQEALAASAQGIEQATTLREAFQRAAACLTGLV
jgi:hypothetical protein